MDKTALMIRYITFFERLLAERDTQLQQKIAEEIARFSSDMNDEIEERYPDEPIHEIQNACLPMEHWNDGTGYCDLTEEDIKGFVRQLKTLMRSSNTRS